MAGDRADYYVYCIRSADGTPRYIGKGCGRRVRKHFGWGPNHPNPGLAALFRTDTPTHELIARDITAAHALEMERRLIAGYGRADLGTGTLCNLTDGGDGPATGYIHSQERKDKIARAHLGRRKSPEHRSSLSAAKKGKPGPKHTEASRAAIGRGNKGKLISAEQRAAMSLAMKGRKLSHEHAAKVSAVLRRPKSEAHKEKLRAHLAKLRAEGRAGLGGRKKGLRARTQGVAQPMLL